MIFSPIKIGCLEVSHRIVVAPRCQYSAINGVMTDRHTQHLMQLSLSSAGLIYGLSNSSGGNTPNPKYP